MKIQQPASRPAVSRKSAHVHRSLRCSIVSLLRQHLITCGKEQRPEQQMKAQNIITGRGGWDGGAEDGSHFMFRRFGGGVRPLLSHRLARCPSLARSITKETVSVAEWGCLAEASVTPHHQEDSCTPSPPSVISGFITSLFSVIRSPDRSKQAESSTLKGNRDTDYIGRAKSKSTVSLPNYSGWVIVLSTRHQLLI